MWQISFMRCRSSDYSFVSESGWKWTLSHMPLVVPVIIRSITRLSFSVTKPSNYNNLRILLVYSRHTDSRAFWGHLRQTYCQHSLHRQTLLLVGSHVASLPFGTVFPYLYALLTVSLVLLDLSSRLICSRDICSRSAVCASDTLIGSFARYKFVTYLLT